MAFYWVISPFQLLKKAECSGPPNPNEEEPTGRLTLSVSIRQKRRLERTSANEFGLKLPAEFKYDQTEPSQGTWHLYREIDYSKIVVFLIYLFWVFLFCFFLQDLLACLQKLLLNAFMWLKDFDSSGWTATKTSLSDPNRAFMVHFTALIHFSEYLRGILLHSYPSAPPTLLALRCQISPSGKEWGKVKTPCSECSDPWPTQTVCVYVCVCSRAHVCLCEAEGG